MNPTTPILTQEEFNIGLSKAFAGMEFFDPLKLRNAYAAALAEIARMKNEGWIPCSERLPENEQKVLAFSDYGDSISMWIGVWDNWWSVNYITHWMPLPAPPTPQPEEKGTD